ncbi:hypothetical protein EDC39_106106 [Geothermobacter ehrlichii]|uniref:C4-type zinc ribbon domain-containing protein n=1 Tax=Geothermobacter ehrlichii TaxID=213224 RepID=A0A5D3WI01_9BACT|nr:C4-type zinc ribbon domain-containing protein [Geothermobacter ehrlichii]TYO98505.1 hypothetical protein EDC39_106106 [Geothermobacter ehrlichii]
MREQLGVLRELQVLDEEMSQFEGKKRTLETRVQEKRQELARVQEMVDGLADQMESLKARRRELTAAMEQEQANVTRSDARLPEIKTQKEYVAVLKEIDTAKARIRELQTQMGEIDAQLEALAGDRGEKESELAVIREQVDASQAEVDAELATFAQRLEEIAGRREDLLEKLPAGVRKRYQTLLARRGGQAVVEAKNGACTGCNMHLPPQLYNDLFRVDRILDCPHCNRLLYIVEQG